MKTAKFTTFCILMAFATFCLAQTSPADLILEGGQVRTPSGWREAVAIRNGIIVAVAGAGETDSINKFKGQKTRTIDLAGKTLLPGIHDSHVHPLFAGLEQFACRLLPGATPSAIAEAVEACVAQKKPGEWILGGNWVAAVFAPGQQNKQFLDRVSPDNPVVLSDESHHTLWVNSKALELAGITADSSDPQGGIIQRDTHGEPDGLLRESATSLVERIVPPPSLATRREALILSTNQMLSFGITSFTVASVRLPDIGPLSALSDEGLIQQRVRGCIVWGPTNPSGERLIAERSAYAQPRFSPDCVKIFLDGVPTESHTGAMLEPYVDSNALNGQENGQDSLETGMLLIPQNILEEAVARFDRQGLHVKFHAAGDAAVRAAIDAIAVTREANGFGGPTHAVGHSTFAASADIPRVRSVQMAWEFSPYIWYPTPMAAVDILRAVGPDRMQRWVPIRDALNTGALVVAGSDWSVVPSVNPWLAMETMVTRQMPGGSDETLGEGQRVSLEDAFSILTENGAKLMGHRDRVGSIEVGMHADIIVTATNPFEVPITDVHATKVIMTFIDGEKVFDAASPPRLSAN